MWAPGFIDSPGHGEMVNFIQCPCRYTRSETRLEISHLPHRSKVHPRDDTRDIAGDLLGHLTHGSRRELTWSPWSEGR